MRIVFIGYSDLLWAPHPEVKPLNPSRFSFVYANGRLMFSESLVASRPTEARVPIYIRNRAALKKNAEEFHAFLQGWQRYFLGDSMLFEYYMTIWRDPFDQYALARRIHEDIHDLQTIGFNGLISCQIQRAFFPVGLANYTLGQSLWQKNYDLDTMVDDYFIAAFGADSAACKEFLKVSREVIDKAVQFKKSIEVTPDALRYLTKAENLVSEFSKVVERNGNLANPCHARSWYYIKWYLRILSPFLGFLKTLIQGNPTRVLEEWKKVKTLILTNEDRYQAVFDVMNFVGLMDVYVLNGRFSAAPEDVVQ